MKKIRKYDLGDCDAGERMIAMEQFAKILDVRTEDGVPKIWALVDPDVSVEDTHRTFVVFTVDSEIDDMNGYLHVGSYQKKVRKQTPDPEPSDYMEYLSKRAEEIANLKGDVPAIDRRSFTILQPEETATFHVFELVHRHTDGEVGCECSACREKEDGEDFSI